MPSQRSSRMRSIGLARTLPGYLVALLILVVEACGGDNQTAGVPPGGCTPATCASQGKYCGTIADGCGAILTCGTCGAGQTCGAGGSANVCGQGTCTPTTCAAKNASCGMISDGCSAALTCGTCTSPQPCGGGGAPNVCGSGSNASSGGGAGG